MKLVGGKRWSDTEVAILERWYANRGAAYVARRTGRTWKQVMAKATRLGVPSRVAPKGFVMVSEAAFDAGCSPNTIRKYAAREGVLRSSGSSNRGWALFAYVPVDWASSFASEWRAKRDSWEFVTVREAARAWGVSEAGVRDMVHGSILERRLGVSVRVESRLGENGAPSLRLDREDVAVVASRFRSLRLRARRMVLVKVLAVECGVSPQAVKHRLRAGGFSWVDLPVGRAWCSHVSVEAAEFIAGVEWRVAA